MTETVKFNVNNYVRIKLTPHGRGILLKENERWKATYPDSTWPMPKEDSEGWSRWQLWDLMHVLGPYCIMGCPVPFKTEIEVLL